MNTPYTNLGERAPISEAVVDLRAKVSAQTTVEALKQLHASVAADYPELRERRRFAGEFSVSDEGPPAATGDVQTDGWLCVAADNKRIVQFRLDGFTLNWLHPYDSWDSLKSEAQRLWTIYLEFARPSTVDRIALRYINRFTVEPPNTRVDLDEYLTTAPRIPEGMPQSLLDFVTRYRLPYPEQDVLAIVTQAIEDPHQRKFLLDIDVSRTRSVESRSEHVWGSLDELREIKNQVFFSSVTDRFLECIQGCRLELPASESPE